MTVHTVGAVGEFEQGRGHEVQVDGVEIALFNLESGWYAVSNRCPHKNAPLHLAGSEPLVFDQPASHRGDVDAAERTIACPWHALEFDLETGENDRTGKCVATFDVFVEDGTVKIDL